MEGFYVKAIYLDPSAASFRQELRRHGVANVRDAKNDVLPGIRYQSLLLSNGTYKICSNCTETIKEYTNYVWDAKASEKGDDKPIKRNDHCFAAGTLVTTINGDKCIESIKVGDLVKTRFGYRKVLKTFIHQDDVYEFCIHQKHVRCTQNHRFMTTNGWKESSDLIRSDILFINKGDEFWRKYKLSTESSIEFTLTRNMKVIEDISELIKQTALKDLDISIEMFGSSTMETFPKDTIFITGMGIPTTIALAILNVYTLKNTFPCMQTIFQKNKKKLKELIATELGLSQKNGTLAKKEDSGIANTQKNVSEKKKESLVANAALKNSVALKTSHLNFVQISVSLSGEEIINLIMRPENALNAIEILASTNTVKQSAAQNLVERSYLGKENVYNIMVEEHHEYFVENMLVANCSDAQRYALFSHFFESSGKKMSEEEAEEMQRAYAFKPY